MLGVSPYNISVGRQLSKQEEPVRMFVKQLKNECGNYKLFYERLYGYPPPDKQAIQTLTNYVNRGALTPDFIRRVINQFQLGSLPLDRLYNYDGHSDILDNPNNRMY